MRIGSIELTNTLIVAPMAGVTDRPFRQLCRRLGAGLAVSEMVSSDASLRGTRKTVKRLDHRGEPSPIAVQIVGANPAAMAEAARINVDHGAEIIDINMGCPAKKVCKVAAGSALLRDEPLVGRILDAIVSAVKVPVTLKIRTGWDNRSRNGVRIAQLAENSGVAALAVHGRTRACGFRGRAEYDTVAAIKRTVAIPVIANGDIDTPRMARFVLESTQADGVMLGRAAQGRPWVFRDIDCYLRTGEYPAEPSPHWVRDVLLEHLEQLYSFYGREHGVKVARKHIGWYSRALPGSALFRAAVFGAQTNEEQLRQVRAFFTGQNQEETMAA